MVNNFSGEFETVEEIIKCSVWLMYNKKNEQFLSFNIITPDGKKFRGVAFPISKEKKSEKGPDFFFEKNDGFFQK